MLSADTLGLALILTSMSFGFGLAGMVFAAYQRGQYETRMDEIERQYEQRISNLEGQIKSLITYRSGGVNITTQGDANIGQDVTGRDKK